MVPLTSFQPGAILWLPKARDISTDVHHESNVPAICYGHPVIVLSTDLSRRNACILINTTFGGTLKKVDHRIRKRGHSKQNYLPIYPSPTFVDGAPSLRLVGGQAFVKNSYVHIGATYECPMSWLEKVWDHCWIHPSVPQKLSSTSVQVLARYALSRSLDWEIYRTLASPIMRVQEPRRQPVSIAVENSIDLGWSYGINSATAPNYGTVVHTDPRVFIDLCAIKNSRRQAANPASSAPSGSAPKRPWITYTQVHKVLHFIGRFLLTTFKIALVVAPFVLFGWGIWRVISWAIELFKTVIIANVKDAWNHVSTWFAAAKQWLSTLW